MATIPLSLYNRYRAGDPIGSNRLLLNQFGGASPSPLVGPQNAGDTLAISLYFLDDGDGVVPFRNHRYPGASVEFNLFALGNSHIYAIGTSTTEITPAATAPVVSSFRTGVNYGTSAIHRVLFASTPFTGAFTLTFPGPTLVGAPSKIVAPKGTTVPIPVNGGIAAIQAAIRALPFYYVVNANLTLVPDMDSFRGRLIVTGTQADFYIDYQNPIVSTVYGAGPLPLPTINAGDVQYGFGYSISVPLTAGDFLNLFLSANAPAFLDVLLTLPGAGGGILTAQQTLTQSNPGQAPIADFSGDVLSGNAGLTVNFTDASTNAPTSWAWAFGDGGTSTARNPSHQYTAAGIYTVQLTATNGSGSNTKQRPNYINISQVVIIPPGSVDNCSGGDGANPALPCNYFDGNHDSLDEVEVPRREMMDEHPGLEIWHQTLRDNSSHFTPVAVGTPGGIGGYIARDTPWTVLAGERVVFERVSHNVPPDRSFPVFIEKSLLTANYTYVNGVLTDFQIISTSEKRDAVCSVHYAMNHAGGPPVKPFIQVIPVLGSLKILSDDGTGFPKVNGLFSNNKASSYIDSSHERVIGNLYCRKIFTG